MTPEPQRFGAAGEEAAVAYLRAHGYVILKRNFRSPGGEIDIVARDANVIVFVEVKARRSHRFGSPLAAVDARKRRRIRTVAAEFLQFYAPAARARFDVLAIDGDRIVLHRGAFA